MQTAYVCDCRWHNITAGAAFYYIGAGSVVRFFMDNEAIIAYGTRFLRNMIFPPIPQPTKQPHQYHNCCNRQHKLRNKLRISQEKYEEYF